MSYHETISDGLAAALVSKTICSLDQPNVQILQSRRRTFAMPAYTFQVPLKLLFGIDRFDLADTHIAQSMLETARFRLQYIEPQ